MADISKKQTFEEFYVKYKNKNLTEILDSLNMIVSDNSEIDKDAFELINEKLHLANHLKYGNTSASYIPDKVIIGGYKNCIFKIFEIEYKFSKELFIDIQLKNSINGSVVITEGIDLSAVNKTLIFLIPVIVLVALVFVSLFVYSLISFDLSLKYSNASLSIVLSPFVIAFIVLIVLLIKILLKQKLSVKYPFKSKHPIHVQTADKEMSKRIVTAAFMRIFYKIKETMKAKNIKCCISNNKLIFDMITDVDSFNMERFDFYTPNDKNLRPLYDIISTVYTLINHFE